MAITTIKQHTFKNGSIKTLIQNDYDGQFDTVYRVTMHDSGNILQCDQTFHYLKSALELYETIAINYNNEKFMTKAGRLTLYALICGYIENKTIGQTRIMLHQLTDDTLIVRNDTNQVCRYFRYNELTKARKFYDSLR